MSRADFDQEEETMALAIVLISLVCIGSNGLTKNSRCNERQEKNNQWTTWEYKFNILYMANWWW